MTKKVELPRKTAEVARAESVTYHKLHSLVRFNKIARPAMDSSGDFLWFEADVLAARAALAALAKRRKGGALCGAQVDKQNPTI
jgi:hypothetical protein